MHRRSRVRRVAFAGLAVVALVASALPSAVQGKASRPRTTGSYLATSLPTVTSGERPGPDVLYSEPPATPQLEHAPGSPFAAPFDRVSGTDRYAGREYFYTDHLYDDRGPGASLEYPADRARYGDNAADLVEFRISNLVTDELAFRFSLNTLLAPDTTMAVAAFDVDRDAATGSATLPFDPGAPFPGTDAVLTAWGTGATWSTWDGSGWQTTDVAASADVLRNQLVATVPVAATTDGVWRSTVAVGLRDAATGSFVVPDEGDGENGIYNVGFRFDEPIVEEGDEPDAAQSDALAADAPTTFAHDIDLHALRAGATNRTTVPEHGSMVRFFPSRLPLGEGKDLESFPAFLGPLQPYTLYVPTTYQAGEPTPLTLNLHSLGQRHWQYTGSKGTQQLGEERGNLVATADARGEDGWYQHEAEYDVFEMWNDIAGHFSLDPARTYLTGYSMGGMGTYRLGTLYPDLFARAGTVVGPPGDGIWLGVGAPTGGAETLSNLWLENARNLPFMNIVAAADELVPISGTTQQNIGPAYNGRTSFDALGYRFVFDVYPAAEHLTLGALGYNLPQLRDFFAHAPVDRDPFHVTFAYTPVADDASLGLVHDKAYWVSGVRLRDPAVGTAVSATATPLGKGVIDVESLAFGVDDPTSTTAKGAGTVPLPYVEHRREWTAPLPRPASNAASATLKNVGSATIDLRRARIDSRRPVVLEVVTDGPATLTLVGARGSSATVAVTPDVTTYTVSPGAFSR